MATKETAHNRTILRTVQNGTRVKELEVLMSAGSVLTSRLLWALSDTKGSYYMQACTRPFSFLHC